MSTVPTCYVSRQHYYYSGEKVVEVELVGGRDYSGSDALVEEYRGEGEGQEFTDPREAIEAAIKVRDAWRKDEPKKNRKKINIAIGTTGGMGMEFEPTEMTDKQLRAFAAKRWEELPKCDHCGKVREEKYHIINDPDFGDFCSENCAEIAYDLHRQKFCPCGEDVPDGRKYFCCDECEEKYEE